MKRWEQFNEYTETPECMEEQAIKVYTGKLIEHIESACGVPVGEAVKIVDCYGLYAAIKDWLNEEVIENERNKHGTFHTWNDKEPWSVEDLRKLKVQDE